MIDELPAAPDPATDSPTEFSAKAAAFVLAQRALPGQMNAAIAEFGALAAGGVFAFPYVFDSSTADADPGVGKLRLGSATQNAATVMRMDLQAVGGADMTNVLADLRSVTSAVKGSVRVVKKTDPSKWLIFDVTAIALPTGYRNLTVSWRATGGGLASPFANGDELMVFVERNGDAGSIAPGSTVLLSSIVVSSPVAAISALNIFSSAYDFYIVEVDNLVFSQVQGPQVRFAVGGVLDATSNYASSPGNARADANGAAMFASSTRDRFTGVMEFTNVNGNSPPVWIYRGSYYNSGLAGSSPYGSESGAGLLNKNVIATGFAISPAAGTINSGTVRIYGVRNS